MFNTEGILYPDSVVGTDSHTTMIDGLGVAGWGVGGIEAEAAMLGQVKEYPHKCPLGKKGFLRTVYKNIVFMRACLNCFKLFSLVLF